MSFAKSGAPTMAESTPVAGRLPGTRTIFGRALRRRCPACGSPGIFTGWARMAHECPSCGMVLQRREDGYTLGGLWLNLLFAELVTTTTFAIVLIRTWPAPPWDLLKFWLPVMALCTPVLFYPFSKTLFLALDLSVRGRVAPDGAG